MLGYLFCVSKQRKVHWSAGIKQGNIWVRFCLTSLVTLIPFLHSNKVYIDTGSVSKRLNRILLRIKWCKCKAALSIKIKALQNQVYHSFQICQFINSKQLRLMTLYDGLAFMQRASSESV
jgi:hypothetical protein